MTAFLPAGPRGGAADPDHPRLQQRPHSPAERRARWEVRAAQWRAREIAESVFGRVASASLIGIRAGGEMRGLLELGVPFSDLALHERRQAIFLSAVEADPVLAQVPLVYVLAPDLG